MNRAQRRANNINVKMYTTEQVARLLRQENTKVLHALANDYSAVLAMCLRNKLGFGHKRSKRFLTAVSDMFVDLQENRLTIEDIKKTLHSEIGVIIK